MTSSLNNHSLLVVLTGPSGVGKDAVFSGMRELGRSYYFVTTTTTRTQRPNEREGLDYNFLSEPEFRKKIVRNEFLEWAEVYGNLYGVPKNQVSGAMKSGRDVILKTDVQGVGNLKVLAPEGVFIFIAPPTLKDLSNRLEKRMTETPETLEIRLQTAREELQQADQYEHIVINHNNQLGNTIRDIEIIIEQEHRRNPPRVVSF